MTPNYKFWVSLAVFEIFFGFSIFAITRQYYRVDSAPADRIPPHARETVTMPQGNITEADLARFNLLVPNQASVDDPVEISRQANEYFSAGQYDRAAELYEKLLTFGPNNIDTYNNLGLTLHYLGRSTEALQKLNDGIAVDPTHQRIWLTLGFVNSQLGNTGQARAALTNAIEVGADEEIRNSATEMLKNLP